MARYSLSYTAAGLRAPEMVTLARAYAQTQDWDEVRRRALEDDLLMIRSPSSRKRVSRELIKRLRTLDAPQLEALAAPGTDAPAARALAWAAVCRTYEFVAIFCTDVVRERWESGAATLPRSVYEGFFGEQALTHPELEGLSPSTRARLESQLFTMLREMGFLDRTGSLMPYLMPEAARPLLSGSDLASFPTFVS